MGRVLPTEVLQYAPSYGNQRVHDLSRNVVIELPYGINEVVLSADRSQQLLIHTEMLDDPTISYYVGVAFAPLDELTHIVTGRSVIFADLPRWSHDGTKIVFSRRNQLDSPNQLYIMNANGSNIVALTDNDTFNTSPVWFPDDRKILFQQWQGNQYDIAVLDLTTKQITRLTNTPYNENYPDISPNGNDIVFVSDERANQDIYLMNADGSDRRAIITDSSIDASPTFSPDGTSLAFVSLRNEGISQIFRYTLGSGDISQITDSELTGQPVWWR